MQKISLNHKLMVLSGLMFITCVATAQSPKYNYTGRELNTITTAVPFLMIAPDARGGGMGDAGVSSAPDANSMHWNPAKYAFIDKDMGFSVSYSPWLRALVSDINLAYLAGFKRIDDKQTIGASLLYFSLGDITFTDITGEIIGNYKPNEFAVDVTYSRKLGPKWSAAVSARFIHSQLTQGQNVAGAATKAGNAGATDVAFYYTTPLKSNSLYGGSFNLGVNISNIGSKISYSDDNTEKDFIPTNLRFGPSITLDIDEYNTLSFMIDVNKLLVPTSPVYGNDTIINGNDTTINKNVILAGRDPNIGIVRAMYQSFYDAPGGFEEEMREFSFSIGAEYWYDKQFGIRGGYFWEDRTKGNRKFFTLGASLRYNVFGLDFSYLIPTDQKNPLENTLRFTLTFNFDAVGKKNTNKPAI
jgi:hypothetical protein